MRDYFEYGAPIDLKILGTEQAKMILGADIFEALRNVGALISYDNPPRCRVSRINREAKEITIEWTHDLTARQRKPK